MSVELLRQCRGIGMTWLGEPPKAVIDLWEAGWLRRDDAQPYTYTTVDGAVVDEPDEDDS